MDGIIKDFKQLRKSQNIKTIIVHADLMHAIPIIGNNKEAILKKHILLLQDIFECPMWLPTFTFSVIQTNIYDIKNTPSEIGMLNEYFRNEIATWRTPHPIYSYAGTGPYPNFTLEDDLIDSFGNESMFAKMNQPNFFLLQYGCRNGVQRKFLLNYVESLASVPYRIQQSFCVKIIADNETISRKSFYYTNRELRGVEKYRDLFAELKQENLLFAHPNALIQIEIIDIQSTIKYLLQKLREDPFYLLTPKYIEYLKLNKIK